MTAPWITYILAVSAFISVAALALEYVAALTRSPRRFPWVMALTLTVALPVAKRIHPEIADPSTNSQFASVALATPQTVRVAFDRVSAPQAHPHIPIDAI